ncbi:MAG: hypothetical protein WD049_06500 [Candidatus Paceibacterota bacterium]
MAVNATNNTNLTPEAKQYLTDLFRETLNDPDIGRELSEYTKQRLRADRTKKQKTYSLEEVKEKLG